MYAEDISLYSHLLFTLSVNDMSDIMISCICHIQHYHSNYLQLTSLKTDFFVDSYALSSFYDYDISDVALLLSALFLVFVLTSTFV